MICQILVQFPLIALLTQSSLGEELACCNNSSSAQTTNFCQQWGQGNLWHPNPHFQQCRCLQGAGPHYNYRGVCLSVCLSVLLEHRSAVYAGTGSFACCASLSLLLCFFNNLFLKVLTVWQDSLFYRISQRAIEQVHTATQTYLAKTSYTLWSVLRFLRHFVQILHFKMDTPFCHHRNITESTLKVTLLVSMGLQQHYIWSQVSKPKIRISLHQLYAVTKTGENPHVFFQSLLPL